MIELDKVVKTYDGRAAVDHVSLEVKRGELCALVGTSGSGKSTTLKLINRLVAHDGGTIRIDGTDIATLSPVALRRRIGYVIQSIGLFPHWTVERNVATVPTLLGWDRARIAARSRELLELVGLEPGLFAGRYPHQLSGGQQQRVGVARALAAGPEVLLMDEPFGALDPVTRDALQGELLRIHAATGTTIILVTHDVDEAIRLANRIAIMDQGRLLQHDTASAILRHPANDFVRDFVGGERLGMRLLKVTCVRERLRRGAPATGAPVPIEATLEEVVAAMVATARDAVPISENGAVVGAVLLADIAAGPAAA